MPMATADMAAEAMWAGTMVMDIMARDATGAHMRPAPLPEPRQERQPPRTTGRQRPITIRPRHTTMLVGTLIISATTPRLPHAPDKDALLSRRRCEVGSAASRRLPRRGAAHAVLAAEAIGAAFVRFFGLLAELGKSRGRLAGGRLWK